MAWLVNGKASNYTFRFTKTEMSKGSVLFEVTHATPYSATEASDAMGTNQFIEQGIYL